MEISRRINDVWEGPNRVFADRLLSHCLTSQVDPPADLFVRAVRLLVLLDTAIRTATVTPIEHRVQRDSILCSAALGLAELVL